MAPRRLSVADWTQTDAFVGGNAAAVFWGRRPSGKKRSTNPDLPHGPPVCGHRAPGSFTGLAGPDPALRILCGARSQAPLTWAGSHFSQGLFDGPFQPKRASFQSGPIQSTRIQHVNILPRNRTLGATSNAGAMVAKSRSIRCVMAFIGAPLLLAGQSGARGRGVEICRGVHPRGAEAVALRGQAGDLGCNFSEPEGEGAAPRSEGVCHASEVAPRGLPGAAIAGQSSAPRNGAIRYHGRAPLCSI